MLWPWVDLAVLGLATWRLTYLVQEERGPYGVLSRLRGLARVEHDADGEPCGWPDTEMGRLLRCLWCGSLWVGAGLGGLYLWAPGLALVLALPFALSAIAIFAGRVIER